MTREEYVAALKLERQYAEQAAKVTPEISATRLADIDAELARFEPAPLGQPARAGRASGRAPEVG